VKIVLQARAEVALRSLDAADHARVLRAILEMEALPRPELLRSAKMHRLRTPSGEDLRVYRAGQRLRIVLSIDQSACIVEDIVDHERLARMTSRGRQ
jgi:hypothetical protein